MYSHLPWIKTGISASFLCVCGAHSQISAQQINALNGAQTAPLFWCWSPPLFTVVIYLLLAGGGGAGGRGNKAKVIKPERPSCLEGWGPAAVNPSHRLHPPNYKWKAGCVVKDRKGVSVQRGQRGSVRLLTGRTTEGLCKTPKVTIKHAIKLCWTFAGRNKPTCAQQWASLMTTGYFVELWTQLNYCLIKEHGS